MLNLDLTALAQASPPVELDTVRGVFVEGDEASPGARIHLKTHVQIAVRNPDCIIGYFKPVSL
ncbi:MAG: hypothetical protein IPO67_28230 [Deltaproteobacteria bacterium]|nr:hypothetical protein [Deltaproteobacteria bacterium]